MPARRRTDCGNLEENPIDPRPKTIATVRKASFDSVYNSDDPTGYFTSLKPLGYRTPSVAAPIFRRCIAALRKRYALDRIDMLDLCCGYGVNAALVNYRLTMDDLYARYSPRRRAWPLDERLRADAAWFAKRRPEHDCSDNPRVRIAGMDVAENALGYARRVGLLDATIDANLERDAPTPAQAATIARADLVTVTGGMSYIGPHTFGRLLASIRRPRKPWLVLFPLRHVDMRPLDLALREHGLRLEPWRARAFPHRRFCDRAERMRLVGAIDGDIDPVDRKPSRDWLESVCWLARPASDIDAIPLDALVEGDTLPGKPGHRDGIAAR
jgi:hypothetical protein